MKGVTAPQQQVSPPVGSVDSPRPLKWSGGLLRYSTEFSEMQLLGQGNQATRNNASHFGGRDGKPLLFCLSSRGTLRLLCTRC